MANQKCARLLGGMLLLSGLFLSSCGKSYCDCLNEAKKEIPDQEVMQQCRERFADMDEAAVKVAVEQCAGK